MKSPRRFPATLVRLVRRLGLDRNPMRRRSDRVQSWARIVAGALLLVGCLAAAMVGHTRYERRLAADGVDARSGYRVTGRVVSDAVIVSAPDGYPVRGTVRVAWRDRAGRHHGDWFVLRSDIRTVPLWVGADGRASTTMPLGDRPAVAGASVGLLTLFAAAGGIGIAYLALVIVLTCRRLAEWQRQWASVEPGWRRQTL